MSRIEKIFLGLGVGLCIFACSDEEEFVQPSVSFKDNTKEIEVRRDTSDSYTVQMNVFAPNGIQKIVVMDGYTYENIEELTDCQGTTNYELLYPVDFSLIDKDTTLIYLFKVEDQLGKSYNNAFSIRLYKKSHPEISLRSRRVVTFYEEYPFIARAFTGFNVLAGIELYDEEGLLATIDVSDLVDSCDVNYLISNLKFGENKIRMVVRDDRDQVEECEMLITRVEKPELRLKEMSTKLVGGWTRTYKYTYDEAGRLSQMSVFMYGSMMVVTIDYEYNSSGMVELMTTTTSMYVTNYDFVYDASGKQLVKVIQENRNLTTGSETESILVQEVTYENGRISKYYDGINSGWYEPSYVFLWGEYVLEDYISGNITLQTQKFKYIDRYPNPEYVSGLPPVVDYMYVNDTQYLPYMFSQLSFKGNVVTQNSFELDDKGRVKKKCAVEVLWGSSTYETEYIYLDE